jgi:hypothetical protein
MFSTLLFGLRLALILVASAMTSSSRAQGPLAEPPTAVTADRAGLVEAVVGRVELGVTEAELSGRRAADAWVLRLLERRVGPSAVSGTWLPAPVQETVRGSWRQAVDPRALYEVLGQEVEAREHGGYRSFQSSLLVRPREAALESEVADLERRIDRVAVRWRFILLLSPVWWGLLALAHGWFDRVTRGYMPWRGRLAYVLMAIGGPSTALAWGCL